MHNVLRAYFDNHVMKTLASGREICFQQISPFHWMPFIQDEHLREWRSFLAQQLHPGGTVQTVEVFAERQGLPPEEFYSLLNSEERMEKEVFIYFPRELLAEFRQGLLETNIKFLNGYLAPASSGPAD